ncbi:hypothetical protein LguiB_034691 [Lonicera macranthoides]
MNIVRTVSKGTRHNVHRGSIISLTRWTFHRVNGDLMAHDGHSIVGMVCSIISFNIVTYILNSSISSSSSSSRSSSSLTNIKKWQTLYVAIIKKRNYDNFLHTHPSLPPKLSASLSLSFFNADLPYPALAGHRHFRICQLPHIHNCAKSLLRNVKGSPNPLPKNYSKMARGQKLLKNPGGIPTSLRTIGTKHLRNSPHPIHTVSVKRMPEKDMPGWGFNVPNLEEWEALELAFED